MTCKHGETSTLPPSYTTVDLGIVEIMALDDGADCAFDQPCAYGHRVDCHAVYCHNTTWEDAPRKCQNTWYTGGKYRDEDCAGYKPNQNYKVVGG